MAQAISTGGGACSQTAMASASRAAQPAAACHGTVTAGRKRLLPRADKALATAPTAPPATPTSQATLSGASP
ncbi:hypothetical protein G6F54_014329 [Rhizopus delemar]|nr:hypothetical protein G6F54_014329 [Rhizopus delemar]